MSDAKVESVCIFGSTARNSADDLSDRDVLVVSGDRERGQEVAAQWRRDGWSVASYTPTRLRHIVRARSLFVQHLKLESIVVKDDGGWLSSVLCRALPKDSYMADALASVSLAKPIERFHLDAELSNVIAATDIAYVAVRNFGICYLASKKQVSFDYGQIVSELGVEFDLAPGEIDLLMSLRVGKSRYRAGNQGAEIVGEIHSLVSVLSRLFHDRLLSQIDPESPVRRLRGGYSTLRDFEAAVISRFGGAPAGASIGQKGMETAWRWVTRPSDYTWSVRQCDEEKLERLLVSGDEVAPALGLDLPDCFQHTGDGHWSSLAGTTGPSVTHHA